MGPDDMILVFWLLSFKPAFSLSSFTLIKSLFSSSLLSVIRVVSSAYVRLLTFLLAIWFRLACANCVYLCLLLLLFIHPFLFDWLRFPGLQLARPPCPSPSPGIFPSSCWLHPWCHPAISSSDTLFYFCPQSFPASRTFPVSHLFASDDYNTGASASILPVNIQGLTPLRLTCV